MVFCKKKTEELPDLGYDYAPEVLGKYIVYDVDSTIYDDFNNDTTYYKYRIKEKYEEAFSDNEGRPALKIVRYIKEYNPSVSYDNIPWTLKDVWMANKTKTSYEVVEEDVRYVKLSFPVKEAVEWNGNSQNINPEWLYTYKYFDQKEMINTTTFDNVLYVEQKDDKNKNNIHREFYIEKYAKHVGLVYKEIKDLLSYTVTVGPGGIIPVEDRINKGLKYKMTYVTHGIE